MTLQERVRTALGEYQLQMMGLIQQLEDAQNQIAELQKTKPLTEDNPKTP